MQRSTCSHLLLVTCVSVAASACGGVTVTKGSTPGTYTLTASEKNAGKLEAKAQHLCPNGYWSDGTDIVTRTQSVCTRWSPENGGGSLCEQSQDVYVNEAQMTVTCKDGGASPVGASPPAPRHNPKDDARAVIAHYDEIAAKQANVPDDDGLSLGLYQTRQLDIELMKLSVVQQYKVDPVCLPLLEIYWLDGSAVVPEGCGRSYAYRCDPSLRCKRIDNAAPQREWQLHRERYDNEASLAKQHKQPPCEGPRYFDGWQAATGMYYVVSTCRSPHGEALSWVRYRCSEHECVEIKPDDYDRAASAELRLRACRGSIKVGDRTLSCKPPEP